MKKIYEFNLNKKQIVDDVEITRNDKNEEIRITKKVEKLVPIKFFVKRPNRSLLDEAEIFYSVQVSQLIQRGVISINQLQKRFLNDGGIYSDQEKMEYEKIYKQALEKQARLNELSSTLEADRTPEQVEEFKNLTKDIIALFSQIQKFDNNKNSLYSNTAEVIARNKCLLWWTLMLSFKEENNKDVPVFGDGTFEQRMAVYDKMEENENDFEYEMIKKFLLITSLWYFGKADKAEEFDILIKLSESSNILETGKNLETK